MVLREGCVGGLSTKDTKGHEEETFVLFVDDFLVLDSGLRRNDGVDDFRYWIPAPRFRGDKLRRNDGWA